VLAFAIVAGYVNREKLAIKIKSVFVPVTPKPAQAEAQGARGYGAFTGDAPWALSALPECFDQRSKSTSPTLPYIVAHLPKGAAMVRPPATLHYADCTLRVTGDEVLVDRGTDHMRIPPEARVYTAPGSIALLRGVEGGYELRVYRVEQALRPSLRAPHSVGPP
jgi:hypothetical protein